MGFRFLPHEVLFSHSTESEIETHTVTDITVVSYLSCYPHQQGYNDLSNKEKVVPQL